VEVHADKAPMTFSYDPVILKGTLELVTDDPVTGIYYKLNNASDIDYAAPSVSDRFSSYLNLSSIRLKALWGNSAAQFKLGVLYYHGQGVMQDNEKAVYWFKKSSYQGYVPAQSILGALYYYGTGVTKNYEAAYFWLALAGSSGGQKIAELRASIAKELGTEKVLEVEKRVESQRFSR
jgi:TPR repeat protein